MAYNYIICVYIYICTDPFYIINTTIFWSTSQPRHGENDDHDDEPLNGLG